jgi:hypothetical protein
LGAEGIPTAPSMWEMQYKNEIGLYEKVLAKFIANPKDEEISHDGPSHPQEQINDGLSSVCGLSLPDALRNRVHGDVPAPLCRGSLQVRCPCFTVNKSFQQANVLRFSLQVTEDSSPSWRVLPKTMWSFEALPIGSSIDWNPHECIPYGDAPHGVHVENKALPLETYKIYHLSLTARSHNGDDDVLSHTARFCLINDSRGHTVATPIPWDKSSGRWQNEVCAPPDQKIIEKSIQQ